MLEFTGCKNVRIEDVRIENASGWTLRPVNCDQVFIRGITTPNPVIGQKAIEFVDGAWLISA
jgi:polygalacturonase